MTAKMISRGSRCPRPRKLSQAFAAGAGPAMRRHLEGCEQCARDWRAYERLQDIGRELPDGEPSSARAEELRTSLVAAARNHDRGVEKSRWSWRAPMLVGAAAVAGVALWLGLSAGGSSTSEHVAASGDRRATVQASQGAHFVHSSEPVSGTSNEVVRLSRGRITLAVEPLASDERFRVVTGNAEIEVRGTSFDVEVTDDKLVEVVVHSGLVEVRLPDRAPLLLAAGERWNAKVAVTSVGDAVAGDDLAEPVEGGVEEGVEVAAVAVEPVAVLGDSKPLSLPVSPGRGDGRKLRRAPAPAPRRQTVEVDEPAAVEDDAADGSAAGEDDVVDDSDADSDADSDDEEEAAPLATPPTASEAAFQSGWQALKAANYGEAAAAFARVIAMAPDAPLAEDARYWEAVALARAGRDEVARRAMVGFLERHPASARAGEVSVMLGWLLLENGESGAARVRFRAAIRDRRGKVRDSARAGLAAIDNRSR